jgi:uncharacterized damage-inducible protein DinB
MGVSPAMSDVDALRYPVGRFAPREDLSADERAGLIREISELPKRFRAAVESLSDAQLETPYRDGGWTARQVVHHVPDSHLQGYARFKLALTEDLPLIKTYDEAAWAETADSRDAPVEPSLDILDALHQRWVLLLTSLSEEDFDRAFRHPEMGVVSLEKNLQLYAWHGRHHLGHVMLVAGRKSD